MVENQHRKIIGYRDLSEVEIGAMNDCKSVAEQVGILCDKVGNMDGVDHRWLLIAQTSLQTGFMQLIRSIARPETF